jgi:alanyl-tRNA synthetase
MGDYSKELCGGCHVAELSHIGFFKIKKESSIAAGVRRIEALCHLKALYSVHEEETLLEELGQSLGAPKGRISESLNQLLEQNKRFAEQIERYEQMEIAKMATTLLSSKTMKGDLSFVISEVTISTKNLPLLANLLMEKGSLDLLFLGQKEGEKCQLLLRVGETLKARGIKASDWIKELAPIVGGSGGGKPDNAQAGGKSPEHLSKALTHCKEMVEKLC